MKPSEELQGAAERIRLFEVIKDERNGASTPMPGRCSA